MRFRVLVAFVVSLSSHAIAIGQENLEVPAITADPLIAAARPVTVVVVTPQWSFRRVSDAPETGDFAEACRSARASLQGLTSEDAIDLARIVEGHCSRTWNTLAVGASAGGAGMDLAASMVAGVPTTAATIGGGVVAFIVSRAQTEVIIWVTTDFGVRLCSRNLQGYDVRSYFPDSCELLTGQGDLFKNELSLQQFGNALRNALQSDLPRFVPILINGLEGSAAATAILQALTSALAGGTPNTTSLLNALQAAGTNCSGQDCTTLTLAAAALAAVRHTGCDLKCAIGKFKDSPAFQNWADHNKVNDAAIETLITDIAAFRAAIDKSGPPPDLLYNRVELFMRLWRTTVATLIPEGDLRANALILIRRVDQNFIRWFEYGLVLYRTFDGIRRGDSPIAVFISATQALKCTSTSDGVCGLALAGLAVKSYATARSQGLSGPALIDRAVELFKQTVTDSANPNLNAWLAAFVAKHPNVEQIRTLVTDVGKRMDDVEDLLAAARKLRTDTTIPADERRKRLAGLARDIITSTNDLCRTALGDVMPSVDIRRITNTVDHFMAAWNAIEDHDYAMLIASLYPLANDLGVREPFPAPIRPYVPLISALAGAETSEDFTSALRTYAVPATTWREKPKDRWSIYVNSFLGGSFGSTNGGADGAVFLPVGIEFTSKRYGLFISAVDFGAVTTVRTGEAKVPDSLTFRDVIVPGVFGRVALGRSPFSIGLGASYVRYQVGDGDPAQIRHAVRPTIFAAVDVPLLALYKRARE